jgi:hypothetical protein
MAGRNIGDLEFTVNADTGKLSAQLVKGGKAAGSLGGKATVKAYNKEIDELGGRKLVSKLAEIRGKIEASLYNIQAEIGLDDKEARAKAKALQKTLSGLEVFINAELRDDGLVAEARLLRERLKSVLDVQADVEIDWAEIKRIGVQAEKLIGKIDAEISPELNKVEARAAIAEMKLLVESQEAKLKVEYDKALWKQQQREIREENKKFAEEAGREFGAGFNKGSMSRLQKIIAALGVVAESAIVGLDALVSQAVAAISSAVAAAGAGIAAVAAQAAGFAGVLAATVTAFAGVGDALSGVNDEFAESKKLGKDFQDSYDNLIESVRDLSPAAATAVLAFAEIRGELANSQALIQEQFFSGMGDEIIKLADDVLPSMTKSLQIGARSANVFAKDLVAIAQNTDFEGLMAGLQPAIDGAFRAASNLVGSLEPFLVAAAPAAELLAEALEGASKYLRDFLTENTDSVSDFLVKGVESLIKWGDMLTSLGHLLGTVFAVGIDSGDTMVTKLDDIITKFDEWLQTAEGNAALVDWFNRGEEAMVAFKPVLEGLANALGLLLTDDAADNFGELAEAIGEALPVVAKMLVILGEAGMLTTLLAMVEALEPVITLIGALPDPILKWAGAMGVVLPLMVKLKALLVAKELLGPSFIATIKKISVALRGLFIHNPALLALSAAIAAVIVVTTLFGKGNDKAKKKTEALNATLRDEVDALIAIEGATFGAEAATQALNATLTSNTKDGLKLAGALGNLGYNVEEATNAVYRLDDSMSASDRSDYLAGVAINAAEAQYGLELTGEQAKELGRIVEGTNDNFDKPLSSIRELAKQSDFTEAELMELAGNMEELQDQAENVNLTQLINDFFEAERASTEVDDSIKDTIPLLAELDDMSLDQLVEAMNEYVGEADELSAEAEAVAAAIEAEQEALKKLEDTFQTSQAAIDKWKNEIIEAGQSAAGAALQAERLTRVTKDIAIEQARAAGVVEPARWVELGDAFRDSAEGARGLDEALNILFGAGLGLDAATDAMISSVSGLNDEIRESAGYTDGWSASIDGVNEDSLALRSGLRDGISSIQDYAVAALEAGTSTDEITTQTAKYRDELVETATQLGGNKEEAEAYINKLLGTPEDLATLIEQPGMIEALLNADNLELLYDEFGNPILTPFLDDGLEATLAQAEELQGVNSDLNESTIRPSFRPDGLIGTRVNVSGLQADLNTADSTVVDPPIPMSQWPGANMILGDMQSGVETLAGTQVDIAVPMSGWSAASMVLGGIQGEADVLAATQVDIPVDVPGNEEITSTILDLTTDSVELGEVNPQIKVTTPGSDVVMRTLDSIKYKIDALYDKTITVTTRNVNTGPNPYGSMTGRLVTGPMNTDVGERGLHEAIIPLQLPLNRVNPEVRGMAAILRGEGTQPQVAAGPNRMVTNNFTINQASDARAVATQVANRAAFAVG